MRKVSVNVLLDPRQHERLRRLSDATRVSAGQYIREGLERVLDLAERQQRTVDSVLSNADRAAQDPHGV